MAEEQPHWDQRYTTGQTPWDSGQPSKQLLRVLESHGIAPCRMLELGCGSGTNAVVLAQRGFQVTAVDVSHVAVERARAKAKIEGAAIDFHVADIAALPPLGPPFDFVFDRGVYHHMRRASLDPFLEALERNTRAGSLYLTLAGSANERRPEEDGPPKVSEEQICRELSPLFELVELREFRFDGVVIEGHAVEPLAWSALWRRRG
jgi:SAM-dependent methyltransferase